MFLFRWIGRLLSLIIILALVAPGYAASKVWHEAHHPVVRSADVIVILGTAQLNGVPGDALLARLVEAMKYYVSTFRMGILTSTLMYPKLRM